MTDTLELQWTFSPEDFFEEAAQLKSGDCTFVIEAGLVKGRGPLRTANIAEGCNELDQSLDTLFMGAQLLEHRSYQLKLFRIERVTPGGSRHLIVLPSGGSPSLEHGRADISVTDAAGNATVGNRRDRIKRRLALSTDAASFITKPVANSVIRSYSAAVNDPRNELVHLYEIRDALGKAFGSEGNARKALSISATKWRELGRLACNEPLIQGRHRGQHPAALRSATAAELELARGIAREMVERYLAYVRLGGSN